VRRVLTVGKAGEVLSNHTGGGSSYPTVKAAASDHTRLQYMGLDASC
jgi:hypothetical protein